MPNEVLSAEPVGKIPNEVFSAELGIFCRIRYFLPNHGFPAATAELGHDVLIC